jgi:phosphoserine phosphatase RsbU/P
VLVRPRLDADDIARALAPPFAGCRETEEMTDTPLSAHFTAHLENGGIGLVLRTDTAYACCVGLIFAAAISQRLLEPGEQVAELDLAVHEVVANALIHGNLGVMSPHGDLGAFESYCEAVESALADPVKVRRKIQISARRDGDAIVVAVQDEGSGYDSATAHSDVAHRHRHGLDLVSQLGTFAVEEGGRRMILCLSIHKDKTCGKVERT